MASPQASFSVSVDVANPGQFFACCGLLELAHRLWSGAEGWFDNDNFHVTSQNPADCNLINLLERLRISQWTEDKFSGTRSIHPIGCGHLFPTMDWWLRYDWAHYLNKPHEKQVNLMSTPLKLWAGNQSALQIALKLIQAFSNETISMADDLFNSSTPLTGRFGLDPRAAWSAQDVGFSPNAQGMEVNTYPAVEMLGAIGLQRFKPINNIDSLYYAVWMIPLSPSIASAVSILAIPSRFTKLYEFSITQRGSYKGFSFSNPLGGNK